MNKEELEKKIEEAARIAANLPIGFDYKEESYFNGQNIQKMETWITGAKSSEAAEYHTHNLRIEMVAKCAKMIAEFKATGEYRKGFADVADKALKEMGSTIHTDAEIRTIAIEFFIHWYDSPGTNTEQGFDDWWKNRNLSETEKS